MIIKAWNIVGQWKLLRTLLADSEFQLTKNQQSQQSKPQPVNVENSFLKLKWLKCEYFSNFYFASSFLLSVAKCKAFRMEFYSPIFRRGPNSLAAPSPPSSSEESRPKRKDGQVWIKYEEYKLIESLLSRYVKCFWRKNSISLFPLVSLNHWFIMIFFSGKHLLVVPNLLCHISSSSVIVRLWLVMSF